MESNKLKTRDEIEQQDKWEVEKIYADTGSWEKDFSELKELAKTIKNFENKLSDPNMLLEYLKSDEHISRLAEKLYVYAHLKSDEDTANTENQSLKNKVDSYLAELKSYQSFFIPEILELPDGTLDSALDSNKELQMYKFMLEDIVKMKPHTLNKDEEKLLAAVSDCLEAPSNIFGMLTNADMTFPNIKDESGRDIELTEVNYASFIKSKNRDVRKEAFKALFSTYEKFKNTFGVALTASTKNFAFNAKTRKYKSSLESSLKPNDIPLEVYDNAIETINKNLSSLHRYVKVKKKLLGLEEIHMYDLYVPIVDIEKDHVEFNRGVQIAKEALQPLGEEYLKIFDEGINGGWIDKYENKGKRGGAYSWGCYDTMPYVLLNYNYQLNDVSTLVHEMGHSIHSYYSRKMQPFVYADYTLFCAEVASTTNEILLINYLINKEQDQKRKLFLANQELEQIRTTVFRQLMFAEFEKITHDTIDKGEPLNCSDLCNIWHDLNTKYFGEEMVVDKEIDMEWARIPHFYSDFYVYQYATGYSAASAFATSILQNKQDAVPKYLEFLKSGGNDYPIEILKKSDVDMTTPEPLETTIKRFNELLDMLENHN